MMASGSPAGFLELQGRLGQIKNGLNADFVVVDPDLRVQTTIIGGREAWSRL